MRRLLPTFDAVHVRDPCNASWEAMTGDDRVRFCTICEKNVHDLSALGADEAAHVLAKRGSVCVRFVVVFAAALVGAGCTSESASTSPAPSASAVPKPPPPAPTYTMGCACKPGDPLCSCL